MPTDLPVLVLIAVAATAVAVAVLRRMAEQEAGGGRPASQAHRPGFLTGALDMVDASIGMHMVRRMLGRPTTTRAEGRAERARVTLAAAEEDARRASLDEPSLVAPTRLVVAGTAAEHAPRELRDRQAHPLAVGPQVPVWRRRRAAMPSQGVLAAAGLIGLFVVAFSAAFAFWPRPDAGVLSATGTPEPSDLPAATQIPTDSPTTSAPAAEPTAILTPTPSPTATPAAGATATPTAAPTRTPRPTARPTSTPRATASPTPTPTATVEPTPSPTPEPTATPTPEPTATPTPEPTATPTPDPTPEPPPDPTP